MSSKLGKGRGHRAALLAAVSTVILGADLALAQVRPATQVATQGQATPMEGVFLGSIQTAGPSIVLNDQGQIYFFSTLTGDVVPVTSGGFGNNHAGFVTTGGPLTLVVRRDDLAAGFPAEPPTYYGGTGTAFSQFLGTASTNMDNLGNVSFRPVLNGLAITAANDQAFYFGPAGSPTLVAQEGGAIPASAQTGGITDGQKFGDFNFNSVVNNGKLAFLGNVLTSANAAAGSALFVATADPLNITAVAYGNTGNGTLIGTDRITAINTGRWTLDSAGNVLFAGVLNGSDDALITGTSASDLSVVAREGQASSYADANYSAFDFTDRSRTGNSVVFLATLAGAGVDATNTATRNNRAYFISNNFGTAPFVGLVRENDIAPSQPLADDLPAGATQMRFAVLDNMRQSQAGWVVFSSQLRADNATSGAGSSLYDGIYVGRITDAGAPEVREVALESDRRDFSQAAIHAERGAFDWALERWNGIDGGTTSINASGQVVFEAGASSPDSSLTEVEGYYFYDPGTSRVFRLLGEGDQVLVDPDGAGPLPAAPKTITSLTSLGESGGSGDGSRSYFADNGQLALKINYDGGEGLFLVDVDNYIPSSFHVWSQAGGGDWGTASNWDVNAAPNAERAYAEFSGATTAPATVNVDGPKTVGELYFESEHKYTLAGDAITFQGVADLGHIGVSRGQHEISAPLVLADTTSVIIDAGTDPGSPPALTLSGAISGPGSLRKGGPGALRLTSANSYAGDTVLVAGHLEVSNTDQLGSASNKLVLDGGVLRALAPLTEPRAVVVTGSTRAAQADVPGGIDTGEHNVTLTGPMSFTTTSASAGSDGYIYKTGAGKLTLAGTGGPGGIQVGQGSVEVTSAQTGWGNAETRTLVGTTFTITSAGAVTSEGNFVARGGSTMTFGGPLTTTGLIQASFDSTNGPATIHINAPSSSNTMTVNSGSPTQNSVININANTTVADVVTINSTAGNDGIINVAPNVTFTGGDFSISGELNLDNTSKLVQTQTGSSDGIRLSSAASLSTGAQITAAADLTTSSTATANLTGVAAIGRNVETTGSVNTITFAGPTTTVTGEISLDADSNNDAHVVNFNAGTATVGSVLVNVDTTGTAAVTANSTVNVAQGATLNAGNITLQTNRSSTSTTGTGGLSGTAALNVAGTLSGGNLLLKTDERVAGRNTATVAVNVSGTAAVNHVRHTSLVNNVLQPAPTVGTESVTISGLLQIKPDGGPAGTSVLRMAPTFTGDGRMDLTNNDLVITNTPAATVLGLIRSNRLVTSIPTPTEGKTAGLAWAQGDDTALAALDNVLSGQPFDADDALVKYTYFGDADLDGDADGNDIAKWGLNFTGDLEPGSGARTWTQGDWDYDGDVDGNDAARWGVNFTGDLGGAGLSVDVPVAIGGEASAVLTSLGFTVNVVPEPATATLLALGVLATLTRRRRTPTGSAPRPN